jgi:hypothetical protein
MNPPPDDLRALRGLMIALPVSLVLWGVIISIAYWVYKTFIEG